MIRVLLLGRSALEEKGARFGAQTERRRIAMPV
jgi:hypothetical protein